jgi:cold shock CspA family protein
MSSIAPNSSLVSRAVENTLGLFCDEGEVGCGEAEELSSCHVFSYREDFDYLWGIGGYENESVVEDARASEQEVSIVLVNDSIPDSPEQFAGPSLNIRDRITTYDWVVHFFLSVVAEGEVPSVRLFVLDVTPQASDDSFAAQRLPSLLPLMSWVRVYRLFDDLTDMQARLEHFRTGFMRLAAEVVGSKVPSLTSADEDMSGNAEELIRETWVNELTRPEGRHDVSNLVAPLVLADGLGKGEEIIQDNLRRAALAKLLGTLGVLERQSDGESQVQSPLETKMVENNIFGQFDHVRFLLLDDQAALGYHDVLASLLFGDNAAREEVERAGELESVSSDGSGSLRSITSPGPLVESLFEATGLSADSEQEVDWSQPRVLDSLALGEDEEEFDVLLLDLRLFGAESDSDQDEFLSRLLEFYEQSGAERIGDEQLKRAVKAARQHVEDNEEADDAAELMHLALLPLLLGYVDPSLPVVLFSSTRQQAVIEALAHRPNIITSFHKPTVSGYGEEMSTRDIVVALSEAVVDALRLHEMRCIWKRVVKAEWKHQPVFEVKGQEEGELEVYNLPQDASVDEHPWKNKSREESKGPRPPYLRGEDVTQNSNVLRAVLAHHFTRYIAGSRYFDYISVPSELFERALVPSRILERPWLSNAEFALPRDLDSRNEIARVLRNIRNKKAHGYVYPPDGKKEKEKHRLASMIIFLLFLDFIEEESVSGDQENTLGELRSHLKSIHYHLRKFSGKLKLYHLVNDTKVEWLKIVAFAASYAEVEATDPDTDEIFLSKETIEAVHRLAELLVSGNLKLPIGSMTPHPDPVSKKSTGERVVGEVEEYKPDRGFGFIKNPSGSNIYFHANSLHGEISRGDEIPAGTLIEFVVVDGDEGPEAKNAKRLL